MSMKKLKIGVEEKQDEAQTVSEPEALQSDDEIEITDSDDIDAY